MSHYDCPCMEKCPLHHAMALIGGKWKVQILCAVTNAGAIRYNALRARLDGISNTVLASALRELERACHPARVSGGARARGVQPDGRLPRAAADPRSALRLGGSAHVKKAFGFFHMGRLAAPRTL